MTTILLLPHINAQNANALSSPYTIGFPAMTAFMGAVHALQRLLNAGGFPSLAFSGAAVACHAVELQIHRGPQDYEYSIIGTGNPLSPDNKAKNKWEAPFKRPSFVEEPRCHLDVSLVIQCEGVDMNDSDEVRDAVGRLIQSKMKLAGGDITGFEAPEVLKISDDDPDAFRKLIRKLMPGHVVIERRDLMKTAMEEGRENGMDALDALLDHVKVLHRCEMDENGATRWTARRKTNGWIVPIATGFHGITPLGSARNQRNQDMPHRFAEAVVTLGEFVMPYRIKTLAGMFWHYETDVENNLYLCTQTNSNNIT